MTTTRATDTRNRTPRLVLAILVIAVVATPVLAFPYVLLDRAASRIDVQTDAAWVLLVIHVPTAGWILNLALAELIIRRWYRAEDAVPAVADRHTR
jgi:hypothetical protein